MACDDAAFDEAASGGTIDTETLGRLRPPTRRPGGGLWRNLQRFKEQHNELAPYGRDLRDIEGVALDKSNASARRMAQRLTSSRLYVVAQQARDIFEELVDQALRFSEYAEAPAPAPAAYAEAPAEPPVRRSSAQALGVAAPRRRRRNTAAMRRAS